MTQSNTKRLPLLMGFKSSFTLSNDGKTSKDALRDQREILGDEQSIFSVDSVQTADRLLDKLGLSAEDEMLLQNALRDEEEHIAKLTGIKRSTYLDNETIDSGSQHSAPVLCIPATYFPSLNHSRNAIMRDRFNRKSSRNCQSDTIAKVLNEDRRLLSPKGAAIANDVSKFRYSFLVQTGSDEDLDLPMDSRSFGPVARSNGMSYQYKSMHYNADGARNEPSGLYGSATCYRTYDGMQVNKLSSLSLVKEGEKQVDTPLGSMSPEALDFIQTITSSESDLTIRSADEGRNCSTNTIFSTPKAKSRSTENELPAAVSPSSVTSKDSKKRDTFSLKNFFKGGRATPETPSFTSAIVDLGTPGDQAHSISSESDRISTVCRSLSEKLRSISNSPFKNIQLEQGLLIDKLPSSTLGSPYTLSSASNASDSETQKNPLSKTSSKTMSGDEVFIPPSVPVYHRIKTEHPALNETKTPTIPIAETTKRPDTKVVQKPIQKPPPLPLKLRPRPKPISCPEIESAEKIKVAIQLRNSGKYTEYIEILHELCELGNRTGYLLYGLALRYGIGTRINLSESFRWIFKATGIEDESTEVLGYCVDPSQLQSIPTVSPEPLASALYECGISYLKGYGTADINETKALKYLEKAASLGHINSVVLCGGIWSTKSRYRPKNSYRAAAWYKIAEYLGMNINQPEPTYTKNLRPQSGIPRPPSGIPMPPMVNYSRITGRR
ncbi:HCL351Wp [Eremothecium sinecaudum]|uniref:HCL351Wp n=1 Tax=Eremothecium sinecaudum TaxID=45286 RepID=A0A120K1V9_9SACH|nr:HCL351Wp [Eremothecium sinecaudum]AMD19800.1 HCL351Wp [Eremothecium sinecaudum]